MALDEIISELEQYQTNFVTVTGGEPLAQPNCHHLLTRLCDLGYQVSLETGGAIEIEQVDERVYIVLDIKTPGSGEEPNNKYQNLDHIKAGDALKFVVCNETDYSWAKQQLTERSLLEKCQVFFSPSAEQLNATILADWIVRDQLAVRMQVQLHKILWDSEAGR